MKVLYFCEGFTDIRFVVGLSEICELTLVAPARQCRESGLLERVTESDARLKVDLIEGGRLMFQARSFMYLLEHIRSFDVVLSQEMGRGSLNATIVGRAKGVPVVTYLGTSPVEYFRCRRQRRQIGQIEALAGELFLRVAMTVSGRLGAAVLTTGPYLRDLAAAIPARAVEGYYCGIDTKLFKPVTVEERKALRLRHELPEDKFLVLFSSRISHEKDPETVLRAVAMARLQGLDAVVINLGGGFQGVPQHCAIPSNLPGRRQLGHRPACRPSDEGSLRVRAGGRSRRAGVACRRRRHVAARGRRMRNAGGGDGRWRTGADVEGDCPADARARTRTAMRDAILWVARNRERGGRAGPARTGIRRSHVVARQSVLDDQKRVE